MKVLNLISTLAVRYGGASRAMALMERALLERGIDVEAATMDDDGCVFAFAIACTYGKSARRDAACV